jgi:hypothetical protein
MTPKLLGGDTQTWANRLVKYLDQVRSLLARKVPGASAKEDGVLLWDAENEYPVVSKNGEFRQIVLSDGQCFCSSTANQVATSANTAYSITFNQSQATDGVTISGDTITFSRSGAFLISFTAQILSNSGSSKNFWFFPEINGVNVSGSTMKASLHDNNLTTVVSRTVLFNMSKNDTMRAMWATDDVNGWLDATAATSFAPASPSVTLSIIRVSQ